MKNLKYYAVFTKTEKAVEVVFPDLAGCQTFGEDFEEAFDMAVDALSAWLSHAEKQFVRKPSSFENLMKTFNGENQKIFPVVADTAIMESYAPKKRVNVVFPVDVLSKIDETRGRIGERNRSKFIAEGMREYTERLAKDF